MSNASTNSLTLPELPELRRKTEAVSQFLRQQIATHLETLRPLFAPERIFGKSAGGKVDVPGAERALTELQQSYRPFSHKPYELAVTGRQRPGVASLGVRAPGARQEHHDVVAGPMGGELSHELHARSGEKRVG